MATNFPSSLDTFTNPSATDTLDSPPHDQQHANINDAVEALEAKVGVDGSAVTSSLDYKVGDHASRLSSLEAISHGKILQVVQSVKTTSFSTTSTSMVDVPDVSVSITPSSTSSKVFVLITGIGGNTGSTSHTLLNIVRDSTAIAQSTGGAENFTSLILNVDTLAGTGFALSYLDSPSTTSATTYKLQTACNTGTAVIGRYAGGTYYGVTTMITVMEVAA